MRLSDKAIFNILCRSSGAIILLCSSVIYVRHLSQQDYGTFLQIMLIYNTVLLLGFLGIPQSIYYFLPKELYRKKFILRTLFITLILSLFFSLIVYFLKYPLVNLFNNNNLENHYWVVVVLIFFGFLIRLREPLLWSCESLLLSGYLTIISNILQLGLPMLGLYWGGSLYYVLLLMIFGTFISLILHIYVYAKVILNLSTASSDCDQNSSITGIIDQFRYALPLGLSNYVGIIGREMDKYFISLWFSPAQFAVYSRGAMQVPLVSSIRFTINDIMMPKFVRLYKDGHINEMLRQWHQIIDHVAKLNYGIFALLFAVTPSLVRILYTEAYMGAVPVLRVYLLLLISSVAVYGMIARVSGKTRLIFWATLLNLPINFILSFVLIKSIGLIGPAIGSVFAAYVVLVWYLITSSKIVNVSFRHIFPWARVFLLLTVATCVSLPLYALEELNNFNGLYSLMFVAAESVVYAVIYMLTLDRLNLMSVDEKDTICRWMKPLPVRLLFR